MHFLHFFVKVVQLHRVLHVLFLVFPHRAPNSILAAALSSLSQVYRILQVAIEILLLYFFAFRVLSQVQV